MPRKQQLRHRSSYENLPRVAWRPPNQTQSTFTPRSVFPLALLLHLPACFAFLAPAVVLKTTHPEACQPVHMAAVRRLRTATRRGQPMQ